MAVANLWARVVRATPEAAAIWFVKLLEKKFQLSCPLTEYIATKSAEWTPSLKNLRPIPGIKLADAGLAVFGSAAHDNLTYP